MLTILEAINLSAEYLEKKGIDEARLNAELMLSEILKCKRLNLYLMFDKPLAEDEITKYREWIARRGKYEPLQYIIGRVEFAGLEFIVNPSVLIPRPETELLVETVVEETDKASAVEILDIGTGSGVIGITLGKILDNAAVTAVDVSEEAIKTAEINAGINNMTGKVKFIVQDINRADFSDNISKYDVIVSNPPYVSETDYNSLQKEILLYEPKTAVSDYSDGLNYYRVISKYASANLNNNGKLFFEIGKDQYSEIENIMTGFGFSNIKIKKDYAGIERVIYGELK